MATYLSLALSYFNQPGHIAPSGFPEARFSFHVSLSRFALIELSSWALAIIIIEAISPVKLSSDSAVCLCPSKRVTTSTPVSTIASSVLNAKRGFSRLILSRLSTSKTQFGSRSPRCASRKNSPKAPCLFRPLNALIPSSRNCSLLSSDKSLALQYFLLFSSWRLLLSPLACSGVENLKYEYAFRTVR